jgi:hypothetical protein
MVRERAIESRPASAAFAICANDYLRAHGPAVHRADLMSKHVQTTTPDAVIAKLLGPYAWTATRERIEDPGPSRRN